MAKKFKVDPNHQQLKLFVLKKYDLRRIALGTIQVLRHQRGGWLGWPNDDVSKNIQGKKICLRAKKKRLEFSLKNLHT